MLNQLVLCGRLAAEPKIEKLENGKKITTIILAVPRSYKNVDGEYETDFISCILWNGIAENVIEYCRKGDLLGIKARLETKNIEMENNTCRNVLEVIVEKVTFLSSKKDGE